MDTYNLFILIAHTSVVTLLTLLTFRLGREFLIAFLALLAVLANLFVLKQVTLFGLTITCTDALAVGYLLGLNLIQEFYGRKTARTMIWIGFTTALAFLLLSNIHLLYTPQHAAYHSLLTPQLRLVCASLATFLLVQFIDLRCFAYLKKRFENRAFPLRTGITLLLAETLDTTLFSFLGLSGLVPSLAHIILFSLLAKCLVILLSLPFLNFARRLHVQV